MSLGKQSSELIFAEFMRSIGLDVDTDPDLRDTPRRFTKMLCEQVAHYKKEPTFTSHSDYDSAHEIKATVFDSRGADSLVIVKDIMFSSICGHHLSSFAGVAHIGYLPGAKIIGISKLGRILDFYAARPQTQEYLTEQVAKCLKKITEARFVGVMLEARHSCMECRGPKKIGAKTITSKFIPSNQDTTKSEFLSLVLR